MKTEDLDHFYQVVCTLRFSTGFAGVFLFPLMLTLIFSACNPKTERKITIAAAANVQFAMDTLAARFERETGIKVHVVTGSSGKLTAQIIQGAPFNIFISADMKYPEELYRNGLTLKEPRVYAYGTLVLWSVKDTLLSDLKMLAADKYRKIALANPKTAPYGSAAVETLSTAGLFEAVEDKLVYGESISQVNQFLITKSADIGFTAKSVVVSPVMRNAGTWTEIDPEMYHPIRQGVVVIKRDQEETGWAEKFCSYLLSEEAKSVLIDFGYRKDEPQ